MPGAIEHRGAEIYDHRSSHIRPRWTTGYRSYKPDAHFISPQVDSGEVAPRAKAAVIDSTWNAKDTGEGERQDRRHPPIDYLWPENPLVSIVIRPGIAKVLRPLLPKACMSSRNATNYELVIVDVETSDPMRLNG